jgi:hypothetical protein
MDWQPGMTYRDEWHYLSFRAKEFDLIKSFEAEKDDVIAKTASSDTIVDGLTTEDYNFVVATSSWWHSSAESLSQDAVGYLKQLINF